EAVRILEHDGAVRTKRGPGGGLVVSAPDSAAIVRAAGLALEHDRVTPQQLVDVRSALEVAAVRMTAGSVSPAITERVMSSVERERAGGNTAINLYEVHHCIAEASGCRPLALFVRVMSELVARHTRPDAVHGSALPKIAAQTHLAHQRIAEAIVAGDADLAERRMRRHLSAALDVMR
ncbi:MAG: FadR family transcriptional regulator, partial [Ilumatobacteraceae bacterium]|nr:FadR family transcriptional regulator [Ilumatobacteraceae bacterium]